MKRSPMKVLAASALLCACLAPTARDVGAQQKSLRDQLVGTWVYVANDIVRPDGTRVPQFGPQPQGLAMFDSAGHYVLLTARSGQPKFASNNRMTGSPEENQSVVQGSIAHFGTYSVNEADKTITFRIELATFPNWNGSEQTRPFVLTGDQLKWTTAASSGGTAEVVLRRAP